MGMSINHVAVLLIHIDSKAADNINAKTSILLPCLALALLLTKRKMAIAKRLCAPDRSKPLAIIKPPISSKIICEPSPAVTENIEPQSEPVVAAEEQAKQQEPVLELNTEDTLIFSFTQDCWVEVEDVTGKMIFADLRKANQILELSGVGPFNVLLGYAPGVTLSYNDEPVLVILCTEIGASPPTATSPTIIWRVFLRLMGDSICITF